MRTTIATWIRHYNSANLIANNAFEDVTPILKQETIKLSSIVKLNLPNGISLEFEDNGVWMYYKKLDVGKFIYPDTGNN